MKTDKIIKNWEYYSKKYNLMLDNENYEDLERAFDEVAFEVLAKQREEVKRVLEGLKGKERKIKKIPDILLGDSGNFNIAIKQVSNEGYNQAIPEFNKKINEAIKNLK